MARLACRVKVIAVDWHEFIFFDWEDEWAEADDITGGAKLCRSMNTSVRRVNLGLIESGL
jgi:hypothetical protein